MSNASNGYSSPIASPGASIKDSIAKQSRSVMSFAKSKKSGPGVIGRKKAMRLNSSTSKIASRSSGAMGAGPAMKDQGGY